MFPFPCSGASTLTIEADGQLAFAEKYFQEGEYYRAIGEFERFLNFFPKDPRAPLAMYYIGLSYFMGERYVDARKAFYALLERFPKNKHANAARLNICQCIDQLDGPGSSAPCFEALAVNFPVQADQAWNQLGWDYIRSGSWQMAEKTLENISAERWEHYKVPLLKKQLGKARDLPYKSPGLAGSLAILPGAGHLYTGRYQDALISFLLNGALIYATYESFNEDLPALGSVVGLVGMGFYVGNIYSATSGAHKANQKQRDEFIRLLETETRPVLAPMTGPDGGLGLGVRVRF